MHTCLSCTSSCFLCDMYITGSHFASLTTSCIPLKDKIQGRSPKEGKEWNPGQQTGQSLHRKNPCHFCRESRYPEYMSGAGSLTTYAMGIFSIELLIYYYYWQPTFRYTALSKFVF